jgi:nitrate reductase (NAD(P)H)
VEKEPWFVVNGEVYDGTAFLEGHPGGATSIIGAAGQDATDEFMAIRKSFPTKLNPDHN